MVLSFVIAALALAEPPTPIDVKVPARTKPVSYSAEVAEILDANCVGCHGAALSQGKLNMEAVAGMLKGGKHGPAIVPGKADESLLFQMAAHRVEPVMPPKDKKDLKPLRPEELGLLKLWIDAGAKDDSETAPAPKPIEIGSLPPGVHPINAVDITADGRTVAAGRANLVEVFDVDSGQELVSLGGHKDLIQSLRFSPDGRRLAAGSYQFVTIWNVPTGPRVGPPRGGWTEGPRLGPHAFRILAIDFSPDGKLIATGGGEPSRSGEVKIWDAATGKLIRSLDTLHSDTVFALRFSPDGSKLATASADKFLKVINVADGKELKSFEGHTHHVLAVDWKADGKQIITGGADNVLKVWDFATGEQLKTLTQATKQITGLRWVANKAVVLAASGDASVRAWNPDNGAVVRSYEGASDYVFAVAASADGGRVAAGGADGVLLIWNGVNGQSIREIAPAGGSEERLKTSESRSETRVRKP